MQLKSADFVIGTNRNLVPLDEKSVKKAQENLDLEIKGVDDANSTSEEDQQIGTVKKIRTRAQKHWRRFWCCYLLGAVVFLAIFLPVL